MNNVLDFVFNLK